MSLNEDFIGQNVEKRGWLSTKIFFKTEKYTYIHLSFIYISHWLKKRHDYKHKCLEQFAPTVIVFCVLKLINYLLDWCFQILIPAKRDSMGTKI